MASKSLQVDIFTNNDWEAGILLSREHIDIAYKFMEILQNDETEGTDNAAGILQEIEELWERCV